MLITDLFGYLWIVASFFHGADSTSYYNFELCHELSTDGVIVVTYLNLVNSLQGRGHFCSLYLVYSLTRILINASNLWIIVKYFESIIMTA